MIDDLLWDVFQRHFHAFWAIEGSVQVHIQDIHCRVTSVPCGEHMVLVKLDCFNVSCLSGDNAGIVFDEVATDCDPCSLGFLLLWSDCADNAREGDGPAFGDLVFVDEEDGVGALDSTTNALCWVSKFIGCRSKPIVSAVGIFDEISVFHLLSGDVVSDG